MMIQIETLNHQYQNKMHTSNRNYILQNRSYRLQYFVVFYGNRRELNFFQWQVVHHIESSLFHYISIIVLSHLEHLYVVISTF